MTLSLSSGASAEYDAELYGTAGVSQVEVINQGGSGMNDNS